MADTIVIASKVKETVKEAGCNTGSDAIEALNSFAHWLIKEACATATANGRKTVRAYDFVASEEIDVPTTIVVASKAKAAIKESGLNVSGDALAGLNSYLGWALGCGVVRSQANGRKTVRGHDIKVEL